MSQVYELSPPSSDKVRPLRLGVLLLQGMPKGRLGVQIRSPGRVRWMPEQIIVMVAPAPDRCHNIMDAVMICSGPMVSRAYYVITRHLSPI